MKEEIIGGLRNAIERGYSLDLAVQSFINSGYNPQEVHDAADMISKGTASEIMGTSEQASISIEPSGEISEPMPSSSFQAARPSPLPRTAEPTPQKQSNLGRNILIIGLIIILLGIIGAILTLVLYPSLLSSLLG